MQPRNIPTIDAAYWAGIILAGISGANCGDFVSKMLHMGHWRGVLPMALGLLVVLLRERRSNRTSPLYFWVAIILVRTAAMNLADLSTHDFKLNVGMMIAGLTVALTCIVALDQVSARARTLGAKSQGGHPAVNSRYWIAMLIAGMLGTVAGDGLVDVWNIATAHAAAMMAVVLALVLVLRRQALFAAPAFYWVTIVVVQTAGTNIGDLSAHTIGLTVSTALTVAAFISVVLLRPKSRGVALGET